ncbi:MAG TPA: DUF3618 domain-containing protein [Pseudonocardiaceae bacterium]|nr:DUF3618 domain-containing protein [Pseudonocardiaceae bacterium]
MTMTSNPDQIRRRIEHTRTELTADVNALAEKLTPSRAVARRVDRARDTLTNVKDKIIGTAEDAVSTVGDTASSAASATADRVSSMASSAAETVSSAASGAAETVSSAPQAVRRRAQGNPLAAGLIAFGAGWLAASLIRSSRKERELAQQAKQRIDQQLQPMAQQVKQAASDVAGNLREPVQQAFESIKSTGRDAAATVTQDSRAAVDQVSERADQARRNVGPR